MALLSCSQALALLAEKMHSLIDPDMERITLEAAQGRVLGVPIFAERDRRVMATPCARVTQVSR